MCIAARYGRGVRVRPMRMVADGTLDVPARVYLNVEGGVRSVAAARWPRSW